MTILFIRIKYLLATYDLKLAEDSTVLEFGLKILGLTGVPLSGQTLVCDGKQLSKDLQISLKEVLDSFLLDFHLYLQAGLRSGSKVMVVVAAVMRKRVC